MDKNDFIKLSQRRIALTCIGPSAIRNQGASGLIQTSRAFFEENINLLEFRKVFITKHCESYLDDLTDKLNMRFPSEGKSWGAARKGLNLFFRDAVCNTYLADFLNLPTDFEENLKALQRLEIPLDRDVATALNSEYPDLPKWKTIKSLVKSTNKLYQDMALVYADNKGIPRVHLDLIFWRSKMN